MIKKLLTLFLIFSELFLFGQDTITLNTFEVIGVRAFNKTPITKLTLQKKDIDILSYSQELPLLLDKTPNIASSTDGGHNQGYVYFRLRGIDQTRINMTLNGIPLNEPENQGVYFSNFPDFSSSIESMQIQRGVGTTSNGVASYGGSINFEAKQGFEPQTKIELGGGSFETYKFSIENSTGMMGKMAFYTRATAFETNGYKYHSGNNGGSFFLHGGYYGEKDVLKTIVFVGNVKNRMAWFGVDKKDIEIDPRTNYNTDREYDEFHQSLVSLIYTKQISKNSILTSTIYYNRLMGNWDLDHMGWGVDTLQNFQLNHNFYGFISNFNHKMNDLNIDIGVHINGYNREHSSTFEPYTEKLYTNTGYKNDISGFVKIQENIKKITLFVDMQIRYTTFKYNGDMQMDNLEWTFINPKFGITYTINNKLNLYSSIGYSNREPTRTDIFGGIDDPIEYQNLNFESVTDIELGTNFNGNMFNLQANLYYMDFKNELTHNGLLGENGLPIMTNVDNSFRSGLELDFTIYFYKSKNSEAKYVNNFIHSYNRIKDNGRTFQPLYTPSDIMNNMFYIKTGKIYFLAESKIQGKSYIDWENKHTVDQFWIFNFGGGWNFYKQNSINLRLNNITNNQYFTNGYVEGNTEYLFVNPPFNWFLTLKMIF